MSLEMENPVSTIEVGNEHYSPLNLEAGNCENCGENFQKPLFTTNYSEKDLKEYYACPRCLSKIMVVDIQKKDKIEQQENPKKEEVKPEPIKVEDKQESIPGCKNTIGFLKRKPKNTPIPEECFVCSKMIECMAY